MAEDIKIASFHFKKSGNSCDVHVEVDPDDRSQIRDTRVEWDFFPPTPLDAKLWSRKCLPVVYRQIAALMGGTVSGIASIEGLGEAAFIRTAESKIQ